MRRLQNDPIQRVVIGLMFVFVLVSSARIAASEESREAVAPSNNGSPVGKKNPSGRDPAPEGRITMNFDNTDLHDFIKYISDLTGKNFIVDDNVKGNVTIFSPTPITVEEAYQVFLSVLEMKGFTVVESGKFTKIVPSKDARYRDIPTIRGEESRRTVQGDRIITRIIPLNFADANALQGMLRPMVSRESHVVVYAPTNTLIITDYASNVHRLVSIIKDIDVEGSEDRITVIPLEYASAGIMVSQLLALVETAPPQRQPRRALRRDGGASTAEGTIRATRLVADERTNSVVLVANHANTRRIKDLTEQLDTQIPPGRSQIQILYLNNAMAEDMAQVLQQMRLKGTAHKPSP